MIKSLFYITAVLIASALSQPFQGTIFYFPDAFMDDDPSAVDEITYGGKENCRVWDRRVGGFTSMDAHIYIVSFIDSCPEWNLMINPEFRETEAEALAEKYAHHIGQMPVCIRSGIQGAAIHDGNNPWGGGNPLTIHTGMGENYERQGIITETMVHEATHAAFDPVYYTSEWEEAARADGEYISTYARDNPHSEDHSETFLCWIVARYKKDRISDRDFNTITSTIPNRLQFYDDLDLKLTPMYPDVTGNALPTIASAADVAPILSATRQQSGSWMFSLSPQSASQSGVIALYTLSGREISRFYASGTTVLWNGRGKRGKRVSRGSYVVRYRSQHSAARTKITVTR